MAFDLSTGCPDAWSLVGDLGGRVIVGVQANRTTEFGYRVKDGEEKHLLTISEMPSHSHPKSNKNYYWVGAGDNKQNEGFSSGRYEFTTTRNVSAQGGGQPHNNLSPYIALYYCKKD